MKKLGVSNMIIYRKPFILIMCFVARKMIICSDKSFQFLCWKLPELAHLFTVTHFFYSIKNLGTTAGPLKTAIVSHKALT